jgi:hypothetical protein
MLGDLLASAISGLIPTRPWWTFFLFLAALGVVVGLILWF